jgi:hypothetical protein
MSNQTTQRKALEQLNGFIGPVSEVLVQWSGASLLGRGVGLWEERYGPVWNPGVLKQAVKFGHYSCNSAFMVSAERSLESQWLQGERGWREGPRHHLSD